jgi:arylsulfatase A-like enzyme
MVFRRVLWAGAIALWGCAGPAPRQDGRPNFLVVIADDLGWNDVGFHGSKVRTPRLDALAKESVVLDQFYVYPSCSPTRAMLLTGRNASRFGILGALGLDPAQGALPLETVTLAEQLAAAGYRTGISGKWHLGPVFELGATRQGFHHAYGSMHGQLDQFTKKGRNHQNCWFRGEEYIEEPGHATDLIAKEATAFLRRERANPFFLYVAFTVPHYPLQEDEAWVKPYEGVFDHPHRRLDAASITHMDDAIGRILDALDELSLREKTFVFFLSDNGGQRDWMQTGYGGKHGNYEHLGDNRPLRGWKTELYEGGIRVPALARWPGRLEPRTVKEVTSALDFFPTAARLAGGATPAGLEGSDLWPLLSGTGTREPPVIYWNVGARAALREGDWKLIDEKRTGKAELFNIAKDPLEKEDLAAAEPERVKAMRARLVAMKAGDPKP